MFERVTERARKVMWLANQGAQRADHDHIGTEHILLGLMREGSGVGAHALRAYNVSLRKVRAEVEKLAVSGSGSVADRLPLTSAAENVLRHAIEEARKLDHNYVGTGHLLLALLRQRNDIAARTLANLNLRIEDVRGTVLRLLSDADEEAHRAPAPPPVAAATFVTRSQSRQYAIAVAIGLGGAIVSLAAWVGGGILGVFFGGDASDAVAFCVGTPALFASLILVSRVARKMLSRYVEPPSAMGKVLLASPFLYLAGGLFVSLTMTGDLRREPAWEVLRLLFICLLVIGISFGMTASGFYRRARYRPYAVDGMCGKCGYDLTGNVSGRCPECGTDIVVKLDASELPGADASASPTPEPDLPEHLLRHGLKRPRGH